MKFTIKTKKLESIAYAMDQVFWKGFFRLHKNHLEIQETDGGNNAILKMEFPKDFFECYNPDLDDDQEIRKVGFDAQDFKKFLDQVDSEEVTIETKKSSIVFDSENCSFSQPELNLKTDDIEDLNTDIDDKSYDSEMTTKCGGLVDALDKLSIIESPIMFKHNRDSLNIEIYSSSSNYTGEVELDIWNYSDKANNTLMGQSLLKPMRKIMNKQIDDNTNIRLEFGDEKPIIIEPQVEDYKIKYMLTPRIPER